MEVPVMPQIWPCLLLSVDSVARAPSRAALSKEMGNLRLNLKRSQTALITQTATPMVVAL
jgi:hypothetical protein